MTDIFDIKNLFLDYPISYFNTIILFLVFFTLIFILVFIWNKKNKIKNDLIEEKTHLIIDFRTLINSFWEKYDYLDSKEFIKEVNHLFRTYLEQEKKYKDFSKLTLDELSGLDLSKDELSFIKDLYFKEYREQILEQDEKNEIYKNLVKLTSN